MKKIAFAFFPVIAMACMLGEKSVGSSSAKQATTDSGQLDGPYVLYKGDRVFVNYIVGDQGIKTVKKDSFLLTEKTSVTLNILTDEPGKTFQVQLKPGHEIEKAEYTKVSKQFIVSDIEANFRAFRRLLQANKIIDENFNWTFGDGHLVLTGDFVDRGTQQNEVLWLIYSLEDKAKAAGGYVHFVLGNHEIMNLSGDLRYLNPKYLQHASLLNEYWVSLLGTNSELGRWLRTKNVVEKVGDILFCHAGISQAVNRMDLATTRINKLVRPYYADSTYRYDRPETDTLYSDLGPFWYRGYYYGAVKASSSQVDSTLSAYRVKHIATGHTVISDTISVLYNGRLLNTDVHHAKGLSEAVLLEEGNYYRVNSVGERFQFLLK